MTSSEKDRENKLRIIMSDDDYESLIEVAEEHYGANFKKNFGAKQSSGALNNVKKQGSK